jgi:hypothetical protein
VQSKYYPQHPVLEHPQCSYLNVRQEKAILYISACSRCRQRKDWKTIITWAVLSVIISYTPCWCGQFSFFCVPRRQNDVKGKISNFCFRILHCRVADKNVTFRRHVNFCRFSQWIISRFNSALVFFNTSNLVFVMYLKGLQRCYILWVKIFNKFSLPFIPPPLRSLSRSVFTNHFPRNAYLLSAMIKSPRHSPQIPEVAMNWMTGRVKTSILHSSWLIQYCICQAKSNADSSFMRAYFIFLLHFFNHWK